MKTKETVLTGRVGNLQCMIDDIVHRPCGLSHRAVQALYMWLSRYTVAELRKICHIGTSRDDLHRELIMSIHRRRGYAILARSAK